VTTLASHTEGDAASARETSRRVSWWPRLRPVLLAVAFPIVLLLIWHFATAGRPGSLIPPPYDVWLDGDNLMWGVPIAGPGPSRGMVFQDYGLFPWLNVRDNIGFGPRSRRRSKTESARPRIVSSSWWV